MTDHLITRLVVGEPQTLALGQPVRQALEAAGAGALRWDAGTWVTPRTRRQRFLRALRSRQPQTIVVPSSLPESSRRIPRRALAAGAALALALAVAAPFVVQITRGESAQRQELPIAPAAATPPPTAVSVVASAYVLPATSAPTPDSQPLPMAAPPDAPAPPQTIATTPQPQAPEQPQTNQPPRAQPSTAVPHERVEPAKVAATPRKVEAVATQPAAKASAQQPVSAVVLDEESHRSANGQAPNPPAASAVRANPTAAAVTAPPTPLRPVASPATAPGPMAVAKAASAPVPAPPAAPAAPAKPPGEHGTGLIAITPDGKVAVFTNPQTRLPQQFKIGDQLPGGDVIRSIDAKAGKVVSSSKEYRFD